MLVQDIEVSLPVEIHAHRTNILETAKRNACREYINILYSLTRFHSISTEVEEKQFSHPRSNEALLLCVSEFVSLSLFVLYRYMFV